MAQEFWSYLVSAFTYPKAVAFLPRLCRLIADREKRRQLLRSPRQDPSLRMAAAPNDDITQGGAAEPDITQGGAAKLPANESLQRVKEIFPDVPVSRCGCI